MFIMKLGITLGDPAGVGPELVLRALAAEGDENTIVFGDRGVLERAARLTGLALPRELRCITQLTPDEVQPASRAVGGAQIAYLEAAVAATQAGEVAGIVTAPIHKATAMAAGFAFAGHTEFLAARLGAKHPVMMLSGPHLRVALATTHHGIAEVPGLLSVEKIAHAAITVLTSLFGDFGILHPRLAVAALNPHAGENGHFGNEEERIITPALCLIEEQLRNKFTFALSGPHVPDVVFREATQTPLGPGRFDAVLAMYHDQGLIPLKLLDFDQAVNVTLGLPIVRTSPDHGVAYDRAWQGAGVVSDGSFRAALRLARDLMQRRSSD